MPSRHAALIGYTDVAEMCNADAAEMCNADAAEVYNADPARAALPVMQTPQHSAELIANFD